MCVATSPADFEATKIYVGNHEHPTEGGVQVLMYANTAANLNEPGYREYGHQWAVNQLRKPGFRPSNIGLFSDYQPSSQREVGPNCMILHIPSGEYMTSDNFIDSSDFPHVLDDMVRSVMFDGSRGVGSLGASPKSSFQVFAVGSYTVLLASPTNIAEGLAHLDESVRPAISREMQDFYIREYPRHMLALCCFNTQTFKSHPMIVWYKTWEDQWRDEDDDMLFYDPVLRFPAIDAHTGKPPVPGELVSTDHWLFTNAFGGTSPYYQDFEGDAAIPWFLPRNIIGVRVEEKLSNGDFEFEIDDDQTDPLESGTITYRRTAPGENIVQTVTNARVFKGY